MISSMKRSHHVLPPNRHIAVSKYEWDTKEDTGGHYFATGGTDHMVRVYNMFTTPTPESWELHGHMDCIMIVKFGHTCSSLFATGSRDGTARVWWFKSSQWENRVGWEWTDHYIITASTPDCNLYVWDVCTGTTLHTLCGHSGEVFVLEPHPHNSRIVLSVLLYKSV
ncbi:PH-interacting protein-like [Dysidea avara]|uniref:PH-interacting protein-like n=1 Tax=Dysidea avara TaxID=196820 RepID=UPI00332EECFE